MAGEDTVKKWEDAYSRHDLEAVAALYAQDVVSYDPGYPEPLKGKEAVRKDAEAFFRAFPDIQMRVSNTMAKDDTVAGEVVMTGTHRGPLEGPAGTVPPTNRHMEVRGAFFARFNAQGLIVEEHRYFDTAGFMAQLGLTGS